MKAIFNLCNKYRARIWTGRRRSAAILGLFTTTRRRRRERAFHARPCTWDALIAFAHNKHLLQKTDKRQKDALCSKNADILDTVRFSSYWVSK